MDRTGSDGRFVGKTWEQWYEEARFGKTADECWEIPNTPSGHRRTHRYQRTRREELLYRIVYMELHGEIPRGTELSHLCHNGACCNPAHIIAESHSANMRRTLQGESHHSAKVTEEVVIQLRKDYRASTGTITELAAKYGLPYMLVYRIVKRKSWTHL